MTVDSRGAERPPDVGIFATVVGHLEAELAVVLTALGAVTLLIATMWCIPSMYYYDAPKLGPVARLLVSVGMVIAVVAEARSVPWLRRRMMIAPHPQPVSIAADVRVRWWPARLALAIWWMAQAAAVFWVAERILGEQAKGQPASNGERVLFYSTRGSVVFCSSFLATVYVLIGLGFAGVSRTWLLRLYRARILIDAGIAVVAMLGMDAAR